MKKYRTAILTLTVLFTIFMFLYGGDIARAVGTAAGTIITNTATGNYTDLLGVPQNQVTSPAASTTVGQIARISLSPTNRAVSEKSGTTAYSALTITNAGNGTDSFTLSTSDIRGWATKVVRDDNGDGIHQSAETTVLGGTGNVAADGTVKCFIAVTIPTTAAGGTTDTVTLRATSALDATATATATADITALQSLAGVSITPTSGADTDKPGTACYYPLTITNTGEASDSFNLTVTDPSSWGAKIINDDNSDGIHQDAEVTVLTSTANLAANASLKCFLAVTVPPSAAPGSTNTVSVKAASAADSTVSATASVTWTVESPGFAPLWTVALGGPVLGSATIFDGIACIGSDDGGLYAIAATPGTGYAPGTILWRFATSGAIRGRPFITYDAAGQLSAIYFTSNDGAVYAVNPDGSLRWRTVITSLGIPLEGTPILSNGILYVAAKNLVIGIDSTTGARRYTSPALNGNAVTTPAVSTYNRLLWVATDTGYVYCLDAKLSRIRWSVFVGAPVSGSPVLVTGSSNYVVVATQGGRIYSLSAEKGWPNKNWGAQGYRMVDGAVIASLFLDNRGLLYFGTTNHRLYSLSAANGATASAAWPYTPAGSGEFRSSALAFPDAEGTHRLYVGGMDGKFHMAPADAPTAEVTHDTGAPFVSSPSASGTGPDDVVVIGAADGRVYAYPLK